MLSLGPMLQIEALPFGSVNQSFFSDGGEVCLHWMCVESYSGTLYLCLHANCILSRGVGDGGKGEIGLLGYPFYVLDRATIHFPGSLPFLLSCSLLPISMRLV